MNLFVKALKKVVLYKLSIMILAFGLIGILLPEIMPIIKVEAAEEVKLNKTKLSVEVGRSYTLVISGTKDNVAWSSSDKNIATVDKSGIVTGVKKGTVTITATVGGKAYSCKVTVMEQEYKVESSGQTVVKTHQEIMNELNMTVIKNATVLGTVDSDDMALQYDEIPDLVDIKLGYFTDKNKVKYYMVAVTNLTDNAFEDGESLSYGSEEGTESILQIKYIQPGETRFWLFGTSHIKNRYVDYSYFKGLSFTYYKFTKQEEYKDIRKDYKVYSIGDNPTSVKLENKQAIKKDYDCGSYLFLLDRKGRLFDVQYTGVYPQNDSYAGIDSYEGIPTKVLVVIEYIVEYEKQYDYY